MSFVSLHTLHNRNNKWCLLNRTNGFAMLTKPTNMLNAHVHICTYYTYIPHYSWNAFFKLNILSPARLTDLFIEFNIISLETSTYCWYRYIKFRLHLVPVQVFFQHRLAFLFSFISNREPIESYYEMWSRNEIKSIITTNG